MVYQTNSRQDTLIKTKGKFFDESEQTVISSIKMFGANIEHSARNNYRPYLMLYGEISAVAFPNGRYQAFFPPTQVHVRYEFSDDELGQLATKGLFYDGFKCPEIISENPNIEIPMKATARRYELMGNLYVSLDLAAKGIYQTNTKDSDYIFASYFEEQIPSKLDTKPVEKQEDVIPTFDDDFAAQFAAEFEQSGLNNGNSKNDEFSKEYAQSQHKQSLVTKDANDLLLKSQAYMREQNRAKAILNDAQYSDEKQKAEKVKLDEFASFRNKPETKPIVQPETKPIIQPFNAEKINSFEPKENDPILSNAIDNSLSFDYGGNYGDAFNGELDELLDNPSDNDEKAYSYTETYVANHEKDTDVETKTDVIEEAIEDTTDYDSFSKSNSEPELNVEDESNATKERIEEAIKNATSTKHNENSQKLTIPDDDTPKFYYGKSLDSV